MQKFSLTSRFTLYSLVVIAAIGFVIGYVLQGQISERVLLDFVARTVATQRSVMAAKVHESDFRPGSKSLAGPDFNRFIERSVISKDTILVKIWRKDGTVLYSNERSIVGKRFKAKHELREALQGQVTFEESDLSGKENLGERPKYGRLLEIYSPVKFHGRVVGAYETYFSLDPVARTSRAITLYISALLAIGLGILWVVLSGLVRRASSTISRQNTELSGLSNELTDSLHKLEDHYLGTMRSLAVAVEARDHYTAGHTHRTGEAAMAVGRHLGLPADDCRHVAEAAELHDIGKIGTPEHVLEKPGPLTSQEWARMKQHPAVGADILQEVPLLRHIVPMVRHHHERYDGSGYPDGLAGDDIPMGARILAAVDAFDAMITDRPYRKAISPHVAAARLKEGAGSQFDPRVVKALIELPDVQALLRGPSTRAA